MGCVHTFKIVLSGLKGYITLHGGGESSALHITLVRKRFILMFLPLNQFMLSNDKINQSLNNRIYILHVKIQVNFLYFSSTRHSLISFPPSFSITHSKMSPGIVTATLCCTGFWHLP